MLLHGIGDALLDDERVWFVGYHQLYFAVPGVTFSSV
jgi:hypothetical protein